MLVNKKTRKHIVPRQMILGFLATSLMLAATGLGADLTLIVPNGFEHLEGNGWMTANMVDEGPPGFRQQVVISHHQFVSVRGPIWITQMRTRPDVQVTTPRRFTYFDVECYLSTTYKTPQTLSTRFSDNTGADQKLIYSGDWTLSTDGGAGLKDFDYVLEFDEPFYYDPSQGDLLFDIVCDGGYNGIPTNSSMMDGQYFSEQTHFCSVISEDSYAAFGERYSRDWCFIHCFTYHPAQVSDVTGDVNADGQVDRADIQAIMDSWRTENQFCDIAPEPDGDGVIDEEDLILVVTSIDADSLSSECDPNQGGAEECGCLAADTERFITIPNGFDTLEGRSQPSMEWQDAQPPGGRGQDLISHLQFKSLPGPVWITGAYYRPDALATEPRETVYEDLEMRLSTTQKTPSTMSRTFAQNIGSDETVVFATDCHISTSGRDSLEDFDYAFSFERPFFYDPSKGNLLVDWTCHGGFHGDAPGYDGQSFESDTQFAGLEAVDPDATTAGNTWDNWYNIVRFTYQPAYYSELAGDLNSDGQIDCADICLMARQWGTSDARCDLAPAGGDGIVDERDLLFLVTYLGLDHPTSHWRFDEAEGQFALDSAGNNYAYTVGGVGWQPEAGCLAGAIELDGVNDCVVTADSVASLMDSPFSLMAWINGGLPGQVIVSQADGEDWLFTDPIDGRLMTSLKGFTRTSAYLASDAFVTDGQWHRVGLVWDGTSRVLFVDAQEVARDAMSQVDSTGGALIMGADKDLEVGRFWSGLIDDVRIYNRAVRP